MATYRGAAGTGFKVIDGKRYRLWGWFTTGDKATWYAGRNASYNKHRKENYVRIIGSRAPFAVWMRSKKGGK